MNLSLKAVSFLIVVILYSSCNSDNKKPAQQTKSPNPPQKETIIIDCNYTFEEAIAGTKAPQDIVNQLQLIDVRYYSSDGKIHQGQILTNKKMVEKLKTMFHFILKVKFPIAHAIPVVKYNWDDNLSMQANNTYSFCYRNPSYSKHATGMAIDINPYFNPLRWKRGYTHRQNVPEGAFYNPKRPGTFHNSNPVTKQFITLGFRWGHTFSRNYDDHHFEL